MGQGDKWVKEFDEKRNVKEANPRVSKQEFGYVEFEQHPRCGNCNMYVMGNKCTIVKGHIDPINGACNFWAWRSTKPIENKKYKPEMFQSEAGYIEIPGGPKCGTCLHYIKPRKCEMVRGDIDPEKGCCIAWE